MNLTLMIKLLPTTEQYQSLLETMERFNAACNVIAEAAFAEHTANKVRLQKLVYSRIREEFGSSAQMKVRAIAKTCEAYKRDKSIKPTFKLHGAIVCDQRLLLWKGLERVSILTLGRRILVPIVFGEYQAARLNRIRGQADLIYRDGVFYLAVVVDVPEPPQGAPNGILGVDLGIKNIATGSDGEVFSGGHVNGLRHRHAKLRQCLQSKGTKSAKRLLKNLVEKNLASLRM